MHLGIFIILKATCDVVSLQIIALDELVKTVVCDTVSAEIARDSSWLRPLLYNKCSEVCHHVARLIASKIGDSCIVVHIVTCKWIAPCSSDYILRTLRDGGDISKQPKHNILRISYGERVLLIDPTYIQFTGTEWNFEESIVIANSDLHRVITDEGTHPRCLEYDPRIM